MTEEKRPHRQQRSGQASLVKRIAEALGETRPGPIILIRRLVKQLGPNASLDYLRRTQEIEAAGGMLTDDGKKRRTPGGVYFHLIKSEHLTETYHIFWKKPYRTPDQAAQPDAETPKRQPLTWDQRIAALAGITKRGTVSVTIQLRGRPEAGSIVDQGTYIALGMQSAKVPNVPKGLPVPPEEPTIYTVYVSTKLWKRIAQAATDPEDSLIIEGFPHLDTQTQSIAVIATGTSSKKLKAAEDQEKAAKRKGQQQKE